MAHPTRSIRTPTRCFHHLTPRTWIITSVFATEIDSGGEEGLQSSLGGILQVGGNTEGDLLALVEGRVRLHVQLRLLPLSSHIGFEFQDKALHMRGVLIHYHSEQAATVRQIFDIAAGSSF